VKRLRLDLLTPKLGACVIEVKDHRTLMQLSDEKFGTIMYCDLWQREIRSDLASPDQMLTIESR
jgi:hypothetical protein